MTFLKAAAFAGLAIALVAPGRTQDRNDGKIPLPPVATFSIVAFDPATQEWGVTVASRYFSVGSVVPWAEAGVGAIATQANVNVGYGPQGLALLREGLTAKQVLDKLMAEDAFDGKDGRQVAIIDGKGNIAAFTGPAANKWAGDTQGKTWSAQGNILVGPQVVEEMGKAFEATNGDLAEKLFAALKAGDAAGGDSRGRQSASMLVVKKGGGRNLNNDRLIYLNVDDNPAPIPELRRLLDMNQMILYQDRSFKLFNSGKYKEAREAAIGMARYAPAGPQIHTTLGVYAYFAGDKPAALEEFRKAKAAQPDFRTRFEAMLKNRTAWKAILDDAEFLNKLWE
ncbi:MAG: DUF1028 domain-containing protein [Bryobacteraceae bacterium]